VIRHDTKKDISGAPFAAVKVDETTDVTRRVTSLRHWEGTGGGSEVAWAYAPTFIFGGAWRLHF